MNDPSALLPEWSPDEAALGSVVSDQLFLESPSWLSDRGLETLRRVGQSMVAAPPAGAESQAIGSCRGCGRGLPWSAPLPGDWATATVCPKCKQWYFVRSDREVSPTPTTIAEGVQSFSSDEFRAILTLHQRVTVSALMSKMLGRLPGVGEERRATERFEVFRPVVTIPLDEAATPIDVAESQTLIDISRGGAGLLGESTNESPLLLVDFAECGAPGLQLLARAVWRQPAEGRTRTGCEFLHLPSRPLPPV